MRTFTKKLLSLVLGAVMLLSLLAGCGGEKAPANGTVGEDTPKEPILCGMVVLTADASFNISFDQEGMVMEISGNNEDGEAIVAGYTDFAGKSCSTVVKELLAATAEATLLRGAKNVVLKLAVGSQVPSETFLDGLTKAATEAVTENAATAAVVTIDLDGLDEAGYINAANAQTLLKNHLGVTEFESYNGDTTPRNEGYVVYVKAGTIAGSYLIDAVTGIITNASEEEPAEPDYTEEETFDPSFEENTEVTDEDLEVEIDPTEEAPAV